jgi:hypothetical protein
MNAQPMKGHPNLRRFVACLGAGVAFVTAGVLVGLATGDAHLEHGLALAAATSLGGVAVLTRARA